MSAGFHRYVSHPSFSAGRVVQFAVGGYRNFATADDSRNNRVVAVLLLGEGWHNNHHHRPRAALHGWRRSELDPIGAGLRLLARLRLVSDLRPGLRA